MTSRVRQHLSRSDQSEHILGSQHFWLLRPLGLAVRWALFGDVAKLGCFKLCRVAQCGSGFKTRESAALRVLC